MSTNNQDSSTAKKPTARFAPKTRTKPLASTSSPDIHTQISPPSSPELRPTKAPEKTKVVFVPSAVPQFIPGNVVTNSHDNGKKGAKNTKNTKAEKQIKGAAKNNKDKKKATATKTTISSPKATIPVVQTSPPSAVSATNITVPAANVKGGVTAKAIAKFAPKPKAVSTATVPQAIELKTTAMPFVPVSTNTAKSSQSNGNNNNNNAALTAIKEQKLQKKLARTPIEKFFCEVIESSPLRPQFDPQISTLLEAKIDNAENNGGNVTPNVWVQILLLFMLDPSLDSLELRGLDPSQRQKLHAIAHKIGLATKSTGPDNNRVLSIRHTILDKIPNETTKMFKQLRVYPHWVEALNFSIGIIRGEQNLKPFDPNNNLSGQNNIAMTGSATTTTAYKNKNLLDDKYADKPRAIIDVTLSTPAQQVLSQLMLQYHNHLNIPLYNVQTIARQNNNNNDDEKNNSLDGDDEKNNALDDEQLSNGIQKYRVTGFKDIISSDLTDYSNFSRDLSELHQEQADVSKEMIKKLQTQYKLANSISKFTSTPVDSSLSTAPAHILHQLSQLEETIRHHSEEIKKPEDISLLSSNLFITPHICSLECEIDQDHYNEVMGNVGNNDINNNNNTTTLGGFNMSSHHPNLVKKKCYRQFADPITREWAPPQDLLEKDPLLQYHSKKNLAKQIDQAHKDKAQEALEQEKQESKVPSSKKIKKQPKRAIKNKGSSERHAAPKDPVVLALPVRTHATRVLHALHHNNVIVVVGQTGSGKSTQIPQLIFEHFNQCSLCKSSHGNIEKSNHHDHSHHHHNNKPHQVKHTEAKILCTQPRRLAAISLAQRVADERGELNHIVNEKALAEQKLKDQLKIIRSGAGGSDMIESNNTTHTNTDNYDAMGSELMGIDEDNDLEMYAADDDDELGDADDAIDHHNIDEYHADGDNNGPDGDDEFELMPNVLVEFENEDNTNQDSSQNKAIAEPSKAQPHDDMQDRVSIDEKSFLGNAATGQNRNPHANIVYCTSGLFLRRITMSSNAAGAGATGSVNDINKDGMNRPYRLQTGRESNNFNGFADLTHFNPLYSKWMKCHDSIMKGAGTLTGSSTIIDPMDENAIVEHQCDNTSTKPITKNQLKSLSNKAMALFTSVYSPFVHRLLYALRKYTHIIIDEAHERDKLIDFTLVLLKVALLVRKDLKVVIMSATINSSLFSDYFNAPIINIEGRTFPVDIFYLHHSILLSEIALQQGHGNYTSLYQTRNGVGIGSDAKAFTQYNELLEDATLYIDAAIREDEKNNNSANNNNNNNEHENNMNNNNSSKTTKSSRTGDAKTSVQFTLADFPPSFSRYFHCGNYKKFTPDVFLNSLDTVKLSSISDEFASLSSPPQPSCAPLCPCYTSIFPLSTCVNVLITSYNVTKSNKRGKKEKKEKKDDHHREDDTDASSISTIKPPANRVTDTVRVLEGLLTYITDRKIEPNVLDKCLRGIVLGSTAADIKEVQLEAQRKTEKEEEENRKNAFVAANIKNGNNDPLSCDFQSSGTIDELNMLLDGLDMDTTFGNNTNTTNTNFSGINIRSNTLPAFNSSDNQNSTTPAHTLVVSGSVPTVNLIGPKAITTAKNPTTPTISVSITQPHLHGITTSIQPSVATKPSVSGFPQLTQLAPNTKTSQPTPQGLRSLTSMSGITPTPVNTVTSTNVAGVRPIESTTTTTGLPPVTWGSKATQQQSTPSIDTSLNNNDSTSANNVKKQHVDRDTSNDILSMEREKLPFGAILIFVAGWSDITAISEFLLKHPVFGSDKYNVIPLHSTVPLDQQQLAFELPSVEFSDGQLYDSDMIRSHYNAESIVDAAGTTTETKPHETTKNNKGKNSKSTTTVSTHKKTPKPVTPRWKIIVSTNIAETSLTIADCMYVIDFGCHKEKIYNAAADFSSFGSTFISQSNCHQRSGRAGRVRHGYCFRFYDLPTFASFPQFPKPEVLTTSIEDLVLSTSLLTLTGDSNDDTSKSTSLIPTRLSRAFIEKHSNFLKQLSFYHQHQLDLFGNASVEPILRMKRPRQRRTAANQLQRYNCAQFLSLMPQPPPLSHITKAIHSLQLVNALDSYEHPTSLTNVFNMLPLPPRLTRVLILSLLFGCFDHGLTAVSVLTSPPIFSSRYKPGQKVTLHKTGGGGGAFGSNEPLEYDENGEIVNPYQRITRLMRPGGDTDDNDTTIDDITMNDSDAQNKANLEDSLKCFVPPSIYREILSNGTGSDVIASMHAFYAWLDSGFVFQDRRIFSRNVGIAHSACFTVAQTRRQLFDLLHSHPVFRFYIQSPMFSNERYRSLSLGGPGYVAALSNTSECYNLRTKQIVTMDFFSRLVVYSPIPNIKTFVYPPYYGLRQMGRFKHPLNTPPPGYMAWTPDYYHQSREIIQRLPHVILFYTQKSKLSDALQVFDPLHVRLETYLQHGISKSQNKKDDDMPLYFQQPVSSKGKPLSIINSSNLSLLCGIISTGQSLSIRASFNHGDNGIRNPYSLQQVNFPSVPNIIAAEDSEDPFATTAPHYSSSSLHYQKTLTPLSEIIQDNPEQHLEEIILIDHPLLDPEHKINHNGLLTLNGIRTSPGNLLQSLFKNQTRLMNSEGSLYKLNIDIYNPEKNKVFYDEQPMMNITTGKIAPYHVHGNNPAVKPLSLFRWSLLPIIAYNECITDLVRGSSRLEAVTPTHPLYFLFGNPNLRQIKHNYNTTYANQYLTMLSFVNYHYQSKLFELYRYQISLTNPSVFDKINSYDPTIATKNLPLLPFGFIPAQNHLHHSKAQTTPLINNNDSNNATISDYLKSHPKLPFWFSDLDNATNQKELLHKASLVYYFSQYSKLHDFFATQPFTSHNPARSTTTTTTSNTSQTTLPLPPQSALLCAYLKNIFNFAPSGVSSLDKWSLSTTPSRTLAMNNANDIIDKSTGIGILGAKNKYKPVDSPNQFNTINKSVQDALLWLMVSLLYRLHLHTCKHPSTIDNDMLWVPRTKVVAPTICGVLQPSLEFTCDSLDGDNDNDGFGPTVKHSNGTSSSLIVSLEVSFNFDKRVLSDIINHSSSSQDRVSPIVRGSNGNNRYVHNHWDKMPPRLTRKTNLVLHGQHFDTKKALFKVELAGIMKLMQQLLVDVLCSPEFNISYQLPRLLAPDLVGLVSVEQSYNMDFIQNNIVRLTQCAMALGCTPDQGVKSQSTNAGSNIESNKIHPPVLSLSPIQHHWNHYLLTQLASGVSRAAEADLVYNSYYHHISNKLPGSHNIKIPSNLLPLPQTVQQTAFINGNKPAKFDLNTNPARIARITTHLSQMEKFISKNNNALYSLIADDNDAFDTNANSQTASAVVSNKNKASSMSVYNDQPTWGDYLANTCGFSPYYNSTGLYTDSKIINIKQETPQYLLGYLYHYFQESFTEKKTIQQQMISQRSEMVKQQILTDNPPPGAVAGKKQPDQKTKAGNNQDKSSQQPPQQQQQPQKEKKTLNIKPAIKTPIKIESQPVPSKTDPVGITSTSATPQTTLPTISATTVPVTIVQPIATTVPVTIVQPITTTVPVTTPSLLSPAAPPYAHGSTSSIQPPPPPPTQSVVTPSTTSQQQFINSTNVYQPTAQPYASPQQYQYTHNQPQYHPYNPQQYNTQQYNTQQFNYNQPAYAPYGQLAYQYPTVDNNQSLNQFQQLQHQNQQQPQPPPQ